MLSLSSRPSSRCLVGRQGKSARPAISSACLLQGQRRLLRPAATSPGDADRDLGLAPESGTGGSGLGRSQGTARPLSGADNAGIGSAPESGTRASEGTPSSAGRASEGNRAAQQAGQDVRSPTGAGLKVDDQLTGQTPGGPQEVSAGWDVPSSDTNPAMDPAESKTYIERETQGSTSVPLESGSQTSAEPQSMRQQGSGASQAQGRDESDSQMGGEGSGGGSNTRTHPVARTAATAIGSAAGTVLGAVGGPVGAAAGAALGGGAARRIADAFAGDERQAEVYDQGAEPEQVAEELLGARAAVGERLEGARDAAGDVAEDIKGRAHEAKEEIQGQLNRASKRVDDAKHEARQQAKQQQSNTQQGRAREDQNDLQGGVGARVQFAGEDSSQRDTGGSSSGRGSDEHGKGLGGAIADAAKSAAHKLGSAADAATGHAQFPEFPPAEGEASEVGTMRAADNLADAAKSAVHKAAHAGEGVPLPQYPPAEGKASDYDTIGSGSSKGEQGRASSTAGGYSDDKSVGDWVRESAEWLGDSIADTAGAARQEGEASGKDASGKDASGGVAGVLRSTVRTAADFGSPEMSERITEMSAQSEGRAGESAEREAGQRARGSGSAMPATASASAAGATDAGWDTADQNWEWGGLPNPEAAVKNDVGAPSLVQQDSMGLAGALGSNTEGLALRDNEQGGGLDAAAAGGKGMSGAVGGAGGYGGASEFGEGMDQMRAQGSGGAGPQTRSSGQQGSSRVGVQAVDEGLPEGRLAAGGDDAQAGVGVRRDESAGSATSDSTAERVAQVYGLGPEVSGGVEEAEGYKAEAGQEGQQDEGASKAFEGA